ncbi:MAG: fatty acyl-AMP ligase [Anaerolineae bacterium]|nr:fatty acyl-AMP ligase [Anaerolineae bacterium]
MIGCSIEVPSSITTLVDLLCWRAAGQPDQQAAAFLDDESDAVGRLTYAELDRKARNIGALLQAHGLAGERALMLYSPGLDFVAAFFGCLYAGVVAVPAYPPRPRTLNRLLNIIKDARPAVILATRDVRELIEPTLAEADGFPELPWLTTDDLSETLSTTWRHPGVMHDSLAFLQYTSGSTTTPRGVMVTHGNLLHNLTLIRAGFEITPKDSGVIWLPLYHDMGLIGGVLQPIFAGLPVTLMSPLTFLQRPFRWLEAISKTGATISGGPNFAYDLCVRKVAPEQRARLDLSRWEVAFSGAEPVRAETIERFTRTFAECGFRPTAWLPCYGLAEATLFVTGAQKASGPRFLTVSAPALEAHRVIPVGEGDSSGRRFVSCGFPRGDLRVAIVDPETLMPALPGVVGEIWISGPSVADGYWGQPQESERVFRAQIASDEDAGTWLRTGDLGFLHEGELYIAGRIKDLIIVDGRNHYPQDIELTVENSHPAIQLSGVAAFSVDTTEAERLVIVAEIAREHMPGRPGAAPLSEITRAIRGAVSEQHAVQISDLVFIRPGTVPKTTSGKIQRHAARAAYLAGALSRV